MINLPVMCSSLTRKKAVTIRLQKIGSKSNYRGHSLRECPSCVMQLLYVEFESGVDLCETLRICRRVVIGRRLRVRISPM